MPRRVRDLPPNDVLRAARLRLTSPTGSGRPMSRQELAEAINQYLWDTHHVRENLDGDDIGKLERGEHRWPGTLRREALRTILRADTDAEVGLYVNRQPARVSEAVSPRPVALPGAVGSTVVADHAGRSFSSVSPPRPVTRLSGSSVHLWELREALHGRTVGEQGMVLIETATEDVDRIYAQTQPADLMPELVAQMRKVTEYLTWPQPVGYRRRLCRVAGRLAGLLAWLHFDLDDVRAADAYYVLAIDAAREAEDPSLLGWLHGGRSLVPYQRYEYRHALALVNAGLAQCPAVVDPAVHAWLAALQARALAHLGERSGFEREFSHAETLCSDTSAVQQRHGMDFHNGRLDLNYYRGGCLLALGRPAEATQPLRLALDILPPSRPKARAVLTLGLAQAAMNEGSLDEAAGLLERALAIAHSQPIMPIVAVARAVATGLNARGLQSSSTRDALQEISQTLSIQSGAAS